MKLYLLFISIVISLSCNGQAVVSSSGGVIYIKKNSESRAELEGKRGGFYTNHSLGDTIQVQLDYFNKLYVKYESSNGAYATEEKVIAKPEIYKSILKLDKYFRKSVKAGEITKDAAKIRFSYVLMTANKVRFMKTDQLESMLSFAKKEEEKENIFKNMIFSD